MIEGTKSCNGVVVLGGGVRGYAAAIVGDEICKRIGKQPYEIFDQFVGTSTGSLLTTLWLLPSEKYEHLPKYTTAEAVEIMKTKVDTVFHNTFLHKIESGYGLLAPKYTTEGFKKAVNEIDPHETKINKLIKDFAFPSYDTAHQEGYLFTKKHALDPNNIQHEMKVRTVLRATTAAPGYFKSKVIGKMNLVDGGVEENDPENIAFIELQKKFGSSTKVNLLVIGTGQVKVEEKMPKSNMGFLNVAPQIVDNLLEAQEKGDEEICKSLIEINGGRRFEVQFDIDSKHDGLDDISENNMKYLKEVAHTWIDEHEEDLEEIVKVFTPKEN